MKVWFFGGVVAVLMGMASCRESGTADGAGGDEGDSESEQPAYVLARDDHRHPEGTVVRRNHALRITEASMTLEAAGGRRFGTMTMVTGRELRMELVSAEETRLEVVKDEQAVTRVLDGVPEKSPAWSNPLLGRPVVFTLVGGAWVGTLEGEPADGEEKRAMESLAAEAGNREAVEMFGTGPRRIGEEWEIDPRNAAVLGSDAQLGGTYRLRFDRVAEFGGERCAVLAGTINVTSKPDGSRRAGTQLEIVAEATIFRSLEHHVNRRLEIAGTILMRESPGPGESMTVRGPVRIVQESELSQP